MALLEFTMAEAEPSFKGSRQHVLVTLILGQGTDNKRSASGPDATRPRCLEKPADRDLNSDLRVGHVLISLSPASKIVSETVLCKHCMDLRPWRVKARTLSYKAVKLGMRVQPARNVSDVSELAKKLSKTGSGCTSKWAGRSNTHQLAPNSGTVKSLLHAASRKQTHHDGWRQRISRSSEPGELRTT